MRTIVTELCVLGEVCPMPILKAKKALAKMASGRHLRVVSTDPHSLPDLRQFCEQTGHVCLHQERMRSENGRLYCTRIVRK